jgi:hypothetical protein
MDIEPPISRYEYVPNDFATILFWLKEVGLDETTVRERLDDYVSHELDGRTDPALVADVMTTSVFSSCPV